MKERGREKESNGFVGWWLEIAMKAGACVRSKMSTSTSSSYNDEEEEEEKEKSF